MGKKEGEKCEKERNSDNSVRHPSRGSRIQECLLKSTLDDADCFSKDVTIPIITHTRLIPSIVIDKRVFVPALGRFRIYSPKSLKKYKLKYN